MIKKLSFILLSALLSFSSCDMQYVGETLEENDEVYLIIFNLPYNTQPHHFSNVFIYNASKAAAECQDYKNILIFKNDNSTTQTAIARIPLVYIDNDDTFADTGFFSISFVLEVDFLTQIILDKTTNFTLFFIEGNALLDAALIIP